VADVVVVGSGIAGLTAAATASRAGASVVLVEGPAPAGRARTDERDGFRLNRGPHAIYDRGAGSQVLRRLGITLDGSRPPRRGVLAWEDRTRPLPQPPAGILTTRLLGPADKARLLGVFVRVLRSDPAAVAHLTVDEWLERSLPERPRELLATLVRIGTYTVDTTTLSADVAVERIQAASRGVTYLHRGWSQLTEALREAAPAVHHVRATAHGVVPGRGTVVVDTDQGPVRGRTVVLACGSPAATAGLLPDGAPGSWGRLGPPVAASCLDLGLRQPPPVASWFGVDRPHYLVAHAPGAALAPEGRALVHAMRNLHHDEATSAEELRADLVSLAHRSGIADHDVVVERYLHHMVVASASVTPAGGGLAGRPGVRDSGLAGVLVAGDWVGPTGWLADASMASGEEAGASAARLAAASPGLRPTTAGAVR
jgi:phytoene dehydrogenase-like protein